MLKKILLISRPRFWLYVLGPYMIGINFLNNFDNVNSSIIWYGIFYFLLPANLFIYAVNDYFDQVIDRQNPKKKNQEIFMKVKDSKLYILLVATSAVLAIPLFFANNSTSLLVILFMFFGFFYSSPPLRFKIKPFLDSFSNFFYILPGVIGYSLVSNSLPDIEIIIAGSFWAVSMHLFSAIVDISADTKAGIKTSATLLGYKPSLLVSSLLWLISVGLVLKYSSFLGIGFLYPLLPIIILIKNYNISSIYWLFPWINAFLGFILFCIMSFI